MKIKILKVNLDTRDKILYEIAKQCKQDDFCTNEAKLFKALIKRENQYTTGFQDGISIPHARLKSITKPIIYIVRNAKQVEWKSLDKKKVKTSFAILLPDNAKAGKIHIDILQKVSNFLINNQDKNIIHKGSIKEIEKNILEKTIKVSQNNKKQFDFVAVTSCPTGIAHTNMAADSLIKFAKDKKLNVKIEKQGANGFENKLTKEDIQNAKMVIIATGRIIDEKNRFNGKRLIEVPVIDAIKEPQNLFNKAKNNKTIYNDNTRKATLKKAISSGGAKPIQALMSGVSYMIPFVIVGGILIAISLGIGGTYKQGASLQLQAGSFWKAILEVGVAGFTLMIPVLAGFIGSAIGGRAALAPSMIIGHLVGNNDGQLFNWSKLQFGGFTNSAKLGFIGAIAAGFLVGYLVKLWNMKVSHKFPKVIKPIEPIIIIPMLSVLIVWTLFSFFIYVPLFYISFGLEKGITYLTDKNLLFIAAIILGAMIAFDMGGPINKVAFLIAGGLIAKGKPELMGAVGAAIAVPPLGTGLAVLSRKLFGVKYDEEDRGNAASAVFMSMIGITEGAIPFAVKYPKQVIVSNVVGGSIGAAIASIFIITNNAQHGGPIVYLLGAVGKNGITNYAYGLLFILSIIIGAIITAVMMNILLKFKQRKCKKNLVK